MELNYIITYTWSIGGVCMQASKAAAANLYETLRMELAGDGIAITEVIPGVVESEITKGKMLTKEGDMRVDQDERDVRPFLFLNNSRIDREKKYRIKS